MLPWRCSIRSKCRVYFLVSLFFLFATPGWYWVLFKKKKLSRVDCGNFINLSHKSKYFHEYSYIAIKIFFFFHLLQQGHIYNISRPASCHYKAIISLEGRPEAGQWWIRQLFILKMHKWHIRKIFITYENKKN